MTRFTLRLLPAAMAAVALTGCNITGALDQPEAFPSGNAPKKDFTPNSAAGLPVAAATDSNRLASLVVKRAAAGSFGVARSDPFALTSDEKSFDRQQEVERVFGSSSGFTTELTPKPVVEEEVTPPEQLPYQRLSGVLVGDSILAIYEEEGRPDAVIITPGSQIPNSPWRVVSIDPDKAVLRRPGKVKPNQIVVRLEQPRNGVRSGGPTTPGGYPGGPGGYPGGGYPGGYPGGRPPGFPGGGRGGRGGSD